jgi:hypothetical protein
MAYYDSYNAAEDAILAALKVKWDADTPALNSAVPVTLVYELTEPDLKPHPRDSNKPWARVIVRHADAGKTSLTSSDKTARYRRVGIVWVQVFAPGSYGSAFTLARQLAQVAQAAYEGKRSPDGSVVFTKAAITDSQKDGAFVRRDMKASFYWDEVK